MTRGAAALIYGGEGVIEGVSGRLIVLDPKHPKNMVAGTNQKLFDVDALRPLPAKRSGRGARARLLAIEDLRLIVLSLVWPFLPHGFGVPGRSIPAWAWLTELARKTDAGRSGHARRARRSSKCGGKALVSHQSAGPRPEGAK